MTTQEFVNNRNNSVLKCDDFYISYNSSPGGGVSFFDGDDGADETAICVDGSFFILNGDHRKELERLAPKGIGECLKYYNTKEDLWSSWSTGSDIEHFLAERAANATQPQEA